MVSASLDFNFHLFYTYFTHKSIRGLISGCFFLSILSGIGIFSSVSWADPVLETLKKDLRICEQQLESLRQDPEAARLVGEFRTLTEFIAKAQTLLNQEEEEDGQRAVLLAQVQLRYTQEVMMKRKIKAESESLQDQANQLEIKVKQERSQLIKIEKALGGILGQSPTPNPIQKGRSTP